MPLRNNFREFDSNSQRNVCHEFGEKKLALNLLWRRSWKHDYVLTVLPEDFEVFKLIALSMFYTLAYLAKKLLEYDLTRENELTLNLRILFPDTAWIFLGFVFSFMALPICC